MLTLTLALALTADAGAAAPVSSRWIWIEGTGGTHLCFYYVDKNAGPSCKGTPVADPPTKAELAAIIDFASTTFRDPKQLGARTATPAEIAELKLPERPKWLDIFEPKGTPAPPPLVLPAQGRVHLAPGAPRPWQLQAACGRFAGATFAIDSGKSLELGSAKFAPGRGVIDDEGVLPTHVTFVSAKEGLMLEPKGPVTVNGLEVKTRQQVHEGEQIVIGKRTYIPRSASWQPDTVGPDPTCPGFKEQVHVQDGCAMYGSSHTQLLGGDALEVGTDRPERTGLPAEQMKAPPVRVKLVNLAGKVQFEALDPKTPPLFKGKKVAKGVLAIGDQLTVGDRVFVITGAKLEKAVKSPLPSCPEAKVKAAAGP